MIQELEILSTNSALYGEQLDKQNRNNRFLLSKIQQLTKYAAHFRGFFLSEEDLKHHCSYADFGDFAYVGKELYCVSTELAWQDSGFTIDEIDLSFDDGGEEKNVLTYSRGDAILVIVGNLSEFEDNYKVAAAVYQNTSKVVKANTQPEDGELELRVDAVNSRYYFVIPNSVSEELIPGEYQLEVAAYFRSAVDGEDFVKRSRTIAFILKDYGVI